MTPALIWDCSVAVAMAFEDERDEYSRRVFQAVRVGGAQVPALWPMEVVNILRVSERRGRIDPLDSLEFLTRLAGLPIQVEGSASAVGGMATLYKTAEKYSLTAYDAAYLRLAQKSGLPLAAKDDDLNSAALRAGIKLFV